ncbi:hypothetical protein LINPERHAP1_LOCUS29154 [Linum perenne]
MIAKVKSWTSDRVVHKLKRLLWRIMVSMVWIERCRRFFTGALVSVEEIAKLIREEVLVFSKGHREERSIVSYM